MNFALNSNRKMESQYIQLQDSVIHQHSIKDSKTLKIQGLSCVKNTSQKIGISGFIVEQKKPKSKDTKQLQNVTKIEKQLKFNKKYSTILNLLNSQDSFSFSLNKFCHSDFTFSNGQESLILSKLKSIKIILIAINIVQQPVRQEMGSLKFFISELKQKGLKVLVILTGMNLLNNISQNKRISFIQQRITSMKKSLRIQSRQDFICIQALNQFHTVQKMRQQILIFPQKQNKNYTNLISVSDFNGEHRNFTLQVPQIKNRLFAHQFKTKNKQNFAKSINKVNSSKILNHSFKIQAKEEPFISINKILNQKRNSFHFQNQSRKTQIKNPQEISYYSLKLLKKIMDLTQKLSESFIADNGKSFFKWFCG